MSNQPTYNLYQARDILGVSLRTIYNMMQDGRLQKVETKKSTFVTRESVLALRKKV